MKFLDIEKSSKAFSELKDNACHYFVKFENTKLYFPVKFTQYSEEDCIKWFGLCNGIFPNKYLGLKETSFGKAYTVGLSFKKYKARPNMMAAISALRLIQYEFSAGMTKIPETTCKLMELGLEFHEALHFAHFESVNICCGHSLRPYQHNYAVDSLENLDPLKRDSGASGYLINSEKRIKGFSSSGFKN